MDRLNEPQCIQQFKTVVWCSTGCCITRRKHVHVQRWRALLVIGRLLPGSPPTLTVARGLSLLQGPSISCLKPPPRWVGLQLGFASGGAGARLPASLLG
jgi:hypothetical protein